MYISTVEPSKFTFISADEVRAASEKALNLWVGALSPLWAPFWAATSFGIGAWALGQGLSRAGDLARDVPLASQWPGFTALPIRELPLLLEASVVEPVAVVVEAIEVVSEAAVAVVETVAVVAEDAVATVAETVVETAAPVVETMAASQPVLDPVVEAPVVPEVAEAIAETPLAVSENVSALTESAKDAIAESVKAADELPVVEAPVAKPKPVAKAPPHVLAQDLAVSKEPAVVRPAPRPKKV